MQFDSFSSFIAMGNYGFYVWLSYGVGAVLLTLLVTSSQSSHKRMIKQIQQRIKRESKLRQAAKQQAEMLKEEM